MGKVCECGCICIVLYIKLAITISFTIVAFQYLFPIIDYSKMEISDTDTETENFIFLDDFGFPKEYNCYMYYFENKNVASKIKKIKAFSRGLVSLFFIQLALEVMIYVIMVISCCCISDTTLAYSTLFYLVLSTIVSAIHLLFFILFSVNYFKVKKETKGFTQCDILSFIENCKTFFICDLIFIFFNFWLNCSWWVKNN